MQDHGGGVDAAIAQFGGTRAGWLDLSTGINPVPYPVEDVTQEAWTALPDQTAQTALLDAARRFWSLPENATIIATTGASAPIAMIPRLRPAGCVHIAAPTYNEHATAFDAAGWHAADPALPASRIDAQVVVHPNNPDGRIFTTADLHASLRIIDESFCDVMPDASLIAQTARPDTLVLKSFGKFWGLAGLRLGFVAGPPGLVEQLGRMLGPWPVSGPALQIAARALGDTAWATATRKRLHRDAGRLDALMIPAGAQLVGGTTLFRLYHVDDAAAWQTRLARHHILTRVFPYNPHWLRVGLPAPEHVDRLAQALKDVAA